jgi:LCP family protein required for cell wall assembly
MLLKRILLFAFLIIILGLQVIIRSGEFSAIFFQVALNKNIDLKKTDPKTINLLLLGIGGGHHDGPLLSDTIIFASLDLKSSKITLVSLPRDMWSFALNSRINSAYAKGESKRKGGGLVLAKSVVGEMVGQPINYGIVIDFSGFVKAVNLLGGLDINVDRTFDDYQYPVDGNENELCGHTTDEIATYIATNSAESDLPKFFPCRYEHLHFDQGMQHLDGETALKYVRSRHAQGEEGTDFARSQRQEKVIRALMDKAFSLNIITNPSKILGLYSTVKGSVDTDIAENEFDDFIKLAEKFRQAKLQTIVLDYGDAQTKRSGLLMHPDISQKYNFEWTLVPRVGENNFSEIHSYIKCRLTQNKCVIVPSPSP